MTISQAGKQQVLQFLETEITHMGLGTAAGSESGAATSLGAEVFRKVVTDKTVDTGLNTLTIECFIGSPEANGFTIQEIGLFDQPAAGNMIFIKNIPATTKTASLEWLLNVVIEVV